MQQQLQICQSDCILCSRRHMNICSHRRHVANERSTCRTQPGHDAFLSCCKSKSQACSPVTPQRLEATINLTILFISLQVMTRKASPRMTPAGVRPFTRRERKRKTQHVGSVFLKLGFLRQMEISWHHHIVIGRSHFLFAVKKHTSSITKLSGTTLWKTQSNGLPQYQYVPHKAVVEVSKIGNL